MFLWHDFGNEEASSSDRFHPLGPGGSQGRGSAEEGGHPRHEEVELEVGIGVGVGIGSGSRDGSGRLDLVRLRKLAG